MARRPSKLRDTIWTAGSVFAYSTALAIFLFSLLSSEQAQFVISPAIAETAPETMRITKPLPEELRPKETFKECDVCPEMIVVPTGRFMMGSPENEQSREEREGPQHRVNFAKSFAVGKFEVTVDQFKAFANETGHDTGSNCREDVPMRGATSLGAIPGFPKTIHIR
jgi:formylglycine-generating enzyme required for sulfatase activity